MNGGENEAPVGAEDMEGSDVKFTFKFRKSKDRSGNGNGACQRANHGEQKKDIQNEPDNADEVIPAFTQTFVPRAVQPGMHQKNSAQNHPQPLVSNTARMRGGHEQKKK